MTNKRIWTDPDGKEWEEGNEPPYVVARSMGDGTYQDRYRAEFRVSNPEPSEEKELQKAIYRISELFDKTGIISRGALSEFAHAILRQLRKEIRNELQ